LDSTALEGLGLLAVEVSRSHHTRQDFSGRVIYPSRRYLATNKSRKRQTSMLPAGFEPEIPANKRALHCTTIEIGSVTDTPI
jgi:hypothetical protein